MNNVVPGWVGLTVATSTPGLASGAIGRFRGGGAGVAHSVSGVARSSTSGEEPFSATAPLDVYKRQLSLWARYGLDVNAINNMGVPVVWENVQNLG